MAGPFDDLIPEATSAKSSKIESYAASSGAFDDLVPADKRSSPSPSADTASGLAAMLQSMLDTEHAAGQRANPSVRKPDTVWSALGLSKPSSDAGEYWRKPLGELEQHDFGTAYRDDKGELKLVNPKTDVVLRDPDTGKHMVFARDKALDDSTGASVARLVLPGIATGPVSGVQRATTVAGRAAEVTGDSLRAERLASATRDLQAFEQNNVPTFGPAFSSGPIAATAKQVTEYPLLGAPARNSLEESILGAKRFGDDVASRYGATEASPEEAGRIIQSGLRGGLEDTRNQVGGVVQSMTGGHAPTTDELGRAVTQGLERYSTQGLTRLPAETVEGLGIDPYTGLRRSPNMGTNQAERAMRAEDIRQQFNGGMTTTTRGVPVPMRRSDTETYLTRRDVGDLTPQELESVVRAPSAQTSFKARQEALYERVWRMIPNQFRADGSRNPQMLPATNVRETLGRIGDNIVDGLSGQTVLGGQLANRLSDARSGNLPFADLRALRTELGRALGDSSVLEKTTLSRTQLKELYAAASQDIENGVIDLANRAYLHVNDRSNSSVVSAQMAREADGALRALKVADRYTRAVTARLERFHRVLKADTPESAANTVLAAAQGHGRGNINMLRTSLAVLRPEERNDIAALVLERMGLPSVGARGLVQEAGFSPAEFLKRFNSLDPRARELLFRPQHLAEINQIVGRAARWDRVRTMFNVDNAQDLYRNITSAAMERGSGANDRLRALRTVLSRDEMGEVAGSVIREMGKPAPSARGFIEEIGFSPERLSNNWARMSDAAKDILFSGSHRSALDDFVNVSNRLANVEALANRSRTLTNSTGIGTALAGAGALYTGVGLEYVLAGLGATGGLSILFSQPKYARWATGYMRLKSAQMKAGNMAYPALASHINRLEMMSRADPRLIPLVRAAREDGVVEGQDGDQGKSNHIRQQYR